ncbi:leucine rich repeat LRR-containing protein [Nitzschia inconspicua]|uniref:Leucine rich repeat LRR-containing protein n=1 Tax=Nitzschia inconspicua TaxID=303405 RepID=A0A9K3LY78_9STRA|nr:leucine rich repeat LRR-containing protein [Nitzschia inconspicua]
MNSWLQDRRKSFATARASSVGAMGSSSNTTEQPSTSRKGTRNSKKKPALHETTKRKGKRPSAKVRREQEEARLNRLQLEHTDDSDYDDSFRYDEEEEVVDDSENDGESSSMVDDETGSIEIDTTEDDDDVESVYTTITVETTRTKENENRKPLGPFSGYFNKDKKETSTQIIVNPADPVTDLQLAVNDITKLSICMKNVHVDHDVASHFLKLMRGDGRSWEAIAVDILRQKARWQSIVLEECTSQNDAANIQSDNNEDYLDLLLAHIFAVDQCAYLHLSNFRWTIHTAWTMQAIMFSKSLTKLQLDLIDLTFSISMLRRGLQDNESLTCLITSRCGLEDDALSELLRHLPIQLEELRIFGNKCRSKGLSALTEILSNRDARLQLLDISYQHVGPNEEFDVQFLAAAIRKNTTLKTLDLDNDSLDDGHLTHIVAALTKNRTLEELMLNHNKITGTGVAMLASKFGEMKGLKKISMYSNVFDATITNTAAGAAASSKNTSLSTTCNGK